MQAPSWKFSEVRVLRANSACMTGLRHSIPSAAIGQTVAHAELQSKTSWRKFHPLLESRICRQRSGPAVNDHAIARRYFVSGMVQGVGFRFFAQRAAENLGIAGYTRNLLDGRVEVYAIGTKQQLEALRDLLRRGPRMASVSDVTEEDAAVQPGYAGGFSIEHSA